MLCFRYIGRAWSPSWLRTTLSARVAVITFLGALVLQGCGGTDHSGTEPTPVGVFADSTLAAHLGTTFQELKSCTELEEGEFEAITVVMMPPTFPCRWYDGTCGGEFVPPNTIKLGSPYLWKHEALHYLLFTNSGNSDPDHTSLFFQSCL